MYIKQKRTRERRRVEGEGEKGKGGEKKRWRGSGRQTKGKWEREREKGREDEKGNTMPHMSLGQQYTYTTSNRNSPEIPPEALWCVKLQPAFDKVGED